MTRKRKPVKRHTKKILISQIEYYEKDKQALLELINDFKNCEPTKKQTVKTRGLSKFLENAQELADMLLEKVERPVSEGISLQINRIFYKYYLAKKLYPGIGGFSRGLEKKLDRLAEYAVIVECGKMYRIRRSLSNPLCAKLDFFLKRQNACTKYFNLGINHVVHLENYTYALDMIDGIVSSRFSGENVRRGKKRMFYIHVGKTNSGKTYSSLQMLKNAEKGAYLSPLRLLALEVSDTLNGEGVPCSLVTGEEERLIENAKHVSSTVELADFHTEYDVAVIDECQMISDRSRGHAWTRAVMNIRAREICLCTAPEALDVLIKLIDGCGDFYEIVNHRRKTPLVVEDKPFSIDDVQLGDALVAFSKQKVNAIGAQLIKKGISVSVLYGALPYTARKQQFESFINGSSTVLVTTDAIGMGVNLPVRRIVFMEIYKFDGEVNRLLACEEIKQIAGRAGRRGRFDTGYVNANGKRELEFVRKRLASGTEKVKGICVNFPKKIISDDYITLKNAVEAWSCYDVPPPYIKESLHGALGAVEKIIRLYNKLGIEKNKQEIFEMATMPVDSRNVSVRLLWMDYIEQRLSGYTTLRKPYLKKKTIDELLSFSKMLDTYFMCSHSWDMEIDFQWLEEKRQKCNEALINGLIDDVESHTRYCKYCGKMLDWNNDGSYCEGCCNLQE